MVHQLPTKIKKKANIAEAERNANAFHLLAEDFSRELLASLDKIEAERIIAEQEKQDKLEAQSKENWIVEEPTTSSGDSAKTTPEATESEEAEKSALALKDSQEKLEAALMANSGLIESNALAIEAQKAEYEAKINELQSELDSSAIELTMKQDELAQKTQEIETLNSLASANTELINTLTAEKRHFGWLSSSSRS